VLRLGHPGIITKAIVDTAHFKGNFPDRCSLEACLAESDEAALGESMQWQTLLPEQKLSADNIHTFERELATHSAITHVRLNMFPDGGISRLRLIGIPTKA
ncbi:MAG: allantoicase, partial [Chitinophagaceae bacterium]